MQSPAPPPNEQRRLAELRRLQVLDTAPEVRFDRLTRIAAAVFQIPVVLVSLVDENRQWFKSRVGVSETETSRDVSFCGHAITGTGVMVVPDARLDNRFADNPLVTGEAGIQFYAGRPLVSREGDALGTLCLIDRCPRVLDDAQIQLLNDLADLVEMELFNDELARMNAVLTRRARVVATLLEGSPEIIQQVDAMSKLMRVSKGWMDALGVTTVPDDSVFRFIHEDDRARCREHFKSVLAGARVVDDLAFRFVSATGEEIEVVGSTSAVVDDDGVFHTLGVFRDVTERNRLLRTLERQARTDVLTGLLNRTCMDDEVKRLAAWANRAGQSACLSLIDVDDFKRVNDAHGHASGDDVLRQIGEVLRTTLRGGDLAFRIGGEEFVVVTIGTTVDEAQALLRRLQSALGDIKFTCSKNADAQFSVGFSAGVAPLVDGFHLDVVLRKADAAMYAAKEAGKGRVFAVD